MSRFDILTLFPEAVEPYLHSSILGRAQEKDLITPRIWNIRDFASDKHHTVDDTPYGGGAGMVMKVEPIDRALETVLEQSGDIQKRRIVVLAARGRQFTQQKAQEYAQLDQLVLICGRYEGIDQRVVDHLADEELSIGPYVLAGGELAALVVVEATSRLVPGVLGNVESLAEESFSGTEQKQEYPQYTKPEEYKGWKVPDVLLSGNHAEIEKWRTKHRK
jgi:tRNA (guanine37-N1)-methyltransferase